MEMNLNNKKKPKFRGAGSYNIDTPDRLLDAAERLFAIRHYEIVSLKEIAEEADANVGQIVYHFRRKDNLVQRVIQRRAEVLNADRIRLLQNYELLVKPENVEIEPLVRAFINPYFEHLSGDDPQWRSFARFIGRTVWDAKLSMYMSDSFDAAACLYLDAFQRALPGLTQVNAVCGFQFMLATMHVSTVNDQRINLLMGDAGNPTDIDSYHAILVPYITGGMAAIAST